jgi:hypothetical protein
MFCQARKRLSIVGHGTLRVWFCPLAAFGPTPPPLGWDAHGEKHRNLTSLVTKCERQKRAESGLFGDDWIPITSVPRWPPVSLSQGELRCVARWFAWPIFLGDKVLNP